MCEAAIEWGLSEIGFAEHLDFDRDDPMYGYFDDGAYTASIAEARETYAGRLVIRKGLEFDFRCAYGTEVGEVLAAWDFDYLIGFNHPGQRNPPPALDLLCSIHRCAETD